MQWACADTRGPRISTKKDLGDTKPTVHINVMLPKETIKLELIATCFVKSSS